ncbi:HSD11B1 [Branchiostoma lanceolatum]|uniref:HSD11B1 protein n=1 Tax=Branchiostoma lanceolatum TaxID=7740 RepID=A0A8J9ZVX0_BRALA|nr:HSD11B1 [Branchiostoma lanceolatum]
MGETRMASPECWPGRLYGGLALPKNTTGPPSLPLRRKVPSPNLSFYSCAKFGLDGFFSSLRVELMKAQQDVSVTLAVLGFVATPTFSDHLKTRPDGDKVLEGFAPIGETALAVIRGGATRARELYYPFHTWPLAKLRILVPQLLEYISVNLLRKRDGLADSSKMADI